MISLLASGDPNLNKQSSNLQSIPFNEMNSSLAEIIENTKLGRDYALLGNYESSLVYYQGVLQQINRLILSITDQARSKQWQEVCSIFEFSPILR